MLAGFSALVVALVCAAAASAQSTQLLPAVTYETGFQFTPHGPVALHIVRGPKPVGLYRLRPERFVALQAWLDQVQAFWGEQLGAFKAHAERTRRRK